jgi:hypothetical protein
MKLPSLFLMLFLLPTGASAQDLNQSTNSLFDDSDLKTLPVKSILVQGEVETPGVVDLTSLPLRSVAIKEVGFEKGERVFKGAYFVGGYSLYDILSGKKFKKAAENTFGPPVDLYVVVENDKGDKAVFSWGEIYYRNSFDILIAKTIQPINPARAKAAYPLPDAPRLINAGDFLNVRFVSNPTKITVRSFHGPVPKDKPKDISSPEISVVGKAGSFTIGDIASSVEKRTYTDVGYGHGMGFKGAQNVSGFLLKDLFASNLRLSPEMFGRYIAVASAKDGYRSVLSLSEIMNRNDSQELLLLEKRNSPGDGRYALYPSGDYFADRDVKALGKIELFEAE